jgi:hypothetical protein
MPGGITFTAKNVNCYAAYRVADFTDHHAWILPFPLAGRRWHARYRRGG